MHVLKKYKQYIYDFNDLNTAENMFKGSGTLNYH